MTSAIIDAYIKEQLLKLNDNSLKEKIQEGLEKDRLSLKVFPFIEPIFIIMHTTSANFHPNHGLHSHDFFEMFYVYKGTATQHTPGGQI